MVNTLSAALQAEPSFRDIDDVYYADTCEPLQRAVESGAVTMSALARGHYPGTPFPGDEVPGVRTVGFWDAPRLQDWGLDWHRNEGIEITYLARGSLGFSVDDKSWPLHANQITITRPWQRHCVGAPDVGPSRLHWCILDVGVRRPNHTWRWPDWVTLSADDLAQLTRLLQHNEQPIWPANREIDATFEALAECVVDHQRSTLESRLRVLISTLLLDVLELLQKQRVDLDEELTSARRGVRVFLDDLDKYLDRKWTLSDMADSCGLGRTQFSIYCQELTNMSPIEYLTRRRLDIASALLLSQPRLPITEIAFRCGFESSQYFSAVFSKHFKLSPAAYRKQTPSAVDARSL
jgi:AraC-like DNA-binding protein